MKNRYNLVAAFTFLTSLSPILAQTNYQQLQSFAADSVDGNAPSCQLVIGSAGLLYGINSGGGTNHVGTVFRLQPDGGGFQVLRAFTNGPFSFGGLIQGSDQWLYGTRPGGGSNNLGIVFQLSKDGATYRALHSFSGTNSMADGSGPLGRLVEGANGILFGTTETGGSNNLGTVFAMSTNGDNYAVLHHFAGTNGFDGSHPFAGLIVGNDGALYGTTQDGGSNNLGTVFRIGADGGNFAVIHHFAGLNGNDGRMPLGEVVQGGDGALYGTTRYGGSNDVGTIFRLDPDGKNYAVLHVFDANEKGNQPWTSLTLPAGNLLYGTTRYGGGKGGGTVFAVSTNGQNFQIIHSFDPANGDGSQPLAALATKGDGVFFGSTFYGGADGNGTLFKLFSAPAMVRIVSIQPTNGVRLVRCVGGAAGQAYNIQGTTNLANHSAWMTLGTTNAAIDGSFQYVDSGSSNRPTTLYRTATP